jgi:hypothetical protein
MLTGRSYGRSLSLTSTPGAPMRLRPIASPAAVAAALASLTLLLAACGSGSSSSGNTRTVNPNAAEVSPAGDIPDNQAYVRYAPPTAGYSVKVPEGWSRSTTGGAVTFTDKLNSIRLESVPAQAPMNAAAARTDELPKLARAVPGFTPGSVSAVPRTAGTAVRITYLAAARTNAVTGRAGTDAVERYLFFHGGREAILTLSGPKGADNVDPWRIVTDSVRWTR